MYITDEERKYLNINFRNMKAALGSNGRPLANRYFDINCEESPIPLFIRKDAPSLRTIADFSKSKKITRETVKKLMNVYNLLFTPSVDEVDFFLSTDIFKTYQPSLISYKTSESFLGEYYCFYPSDNYEKKLHGGILKIFDYEGQYMCCLFMGLFQENLFSQITEHVIEKTGHYSGIHNLRSCFNKYRDQKPDTAPYKNISLSVGTVKVLNRSLLAHVQNINNPNHLTIVTMATPDLISMKQFAGGMGVFISPAVSDLHTRISKILILRKSDITDEIFENIFKTPYPDNKWFDHLAIKANEYGRVEILDDDINKKIQNELNPL